MSVDVEAVRQGADIVAIIGARLKLRRAGSSLKGLCPFHGERTPSFSVDPSARRWHCFGCDESGDVIDFVMRHDGVSFLQAVAAIGGGTVAAEAKRVEPPRAPAVDPSPLLAAIWGAVEDAPWGSATVRYLERRGIEPDAAWVLGCRDWQQVGARITRAIGQHDGATVEAAGLGRSGKLWAPLERLGDPDWRGIAVPVWRVGEAFPWRWRWRFLATPYVGAPKSMSCYSAGASTDFLGAWKPAHGEGQMVGVASLGEGAKTLLVVEGEPDWWSATEAADGRAIVVAVCGAPARWRDAWPSLQSFAARGVERVVVCVHDGAGVDGQSGHGLRFAEDLAVHAERLGMATRMRLPAEGHDLNDMHKGGALAPWLAEVLA